jgi:hypothetical protein
MAMGQLQQSIVPIAIDHVDVDVWGVGVGVVYSVFYSKKLVNAKWRFE